MAPGTAVGVRSLTEAAQLSYSEEVGTKEILQALDRLGLLIRSGDRWIADSLLQAKMAALAITFEAIDIYQTTVQRDSTAVQVVATRPDRALALEREIVNTGWRIEDTEETDQSIADLISQAKSRIVVMTPFLDHQGASILRNLLNRVPRNVQIMLVLRYLGSPGRTDCAKGLATLSGWLRDRHAHVFNYCISHGPGTPLETFHAKVILSDSEQVYVGSANMTGASFEQSVELGVVLTGKAAQKVSLLVEAVLKCAEPWALDVDAVPGRGVL